MKPFVNAYRPLLDDVKIVLAGPLGDDDSIGTIFFQAADIVQQSDLMVIECFEVPAQKLQVGEATKRQLGLYAKLGVDPPVSLQ